MILAPQFARIGARSKPFPCQRATPQPSVLRTGEPVADWKV